MKKILAITAVLALMLGGAAFSMDGWSGQGEVVEMGCYKKGQSGEGHAGCAKKCLSGGAAMGLLDADGNVTKLTAGDDKAAYDALIELAGKQAKVTGTAADGVVTVTASQPAS